MSDRADEIAQRLWEHTWDWERREGISQIADALRDFSKEAVAAERALMAVEIDAARAALEGE